MMGQKRGNRVWRYTMRDIAAASGIPLRTLKEHRHRGEFDPDSMASVMMYGAAAIIKRLASCIEEIEDED